ncbi:hypothetical protein [Embleya sp. NPDC005971]|uniref:hypothetical protein n=1 Tax=Embleya sp. NPDC005971 TaxID=3156724 RepID=UPI0033CF4C26
MFDGVSGGFGHVSEDHPVAFGAGELGVRRDAFVHGVVESGAQVSAAAGGDEVGEFPDDGGQVSDGLQEAVGDEAGVVAGSFADFEDFLAVEEFVLYGDGLPVRGQDLLDAAYGWRGPGHGRGDGHREVRVFIKGGGGVLDRVPRGSGLLEEALPVDGFGDVDEVDGVLVTADVGAAGVLLEVLADGVVARVLRGFGAPRGAPTERTSGFLPRLTHPGAARSCRRCRFRALPGPRARWTSG